MLVRTIRRYKQAIAEQVISRWRDLGRLLGEVPLKAGPGGMARTLVEVVVMVEVGTCGHRQGVMSTWPVSLAGGLHGGEGNGRGVQTGWA